MFAVVEIGGNQFTVQVGDIIDVKKQDIVEGQSMTLSALLISDSEGASTQIGTPFVDGSKVELKAIQQFKAEKVRVFKMKSKKRFMRNRGFRAHMTKMEVLSIA